MPFHRALLLTGAPNDPYVRIIKRDGECYISIPGIEAEKRLRSRLVVSAARSLLRYSTKATKPSGLSWQKGADL